MCHHMLTFGGLVMIKGLGKEGWVTKTNRSVTRVLEAFLCAAADSVVHVVALSFFAFVWGGRMGLAAVGVVAGIKMLAKAVPAPDRGRSVRAGVDIDVVASAGA